MRQRTENYGSDNLAVSKATFAGWVLSEVPEKEIHPSSLDCGLDVGFTSTPCKSLKCLATPATVRPRPENGPKRH
jgi:hypothetical protein